MMLPSPDRWQRISEILDAAFDRAPAERAAYVQEACADDPELRAEVEALLRAEANAPAFLDQQPPPSLRPFLLALAISEDPRLQRPPRRPPLRREDIISIWPMPGAPGAGGTLPEDGP